MPNTEQVCRHSFRIVEIIEALRLHVTPGKSQRMNSNPDHIWSARPYGSPAEKAKRGGTVSEVVIACFHVAMSKESTKWDYCPYCGVPIRETESP